MNPRLSSQSLHGDMLLVDDDPLSRHFVKFIVELELGFSPLMAANAQEALELMAMHTVKILITDLCMPGMSGRELLGLVRKIHRQTKVIILSADFNAAAVTPDELRAEGAAAVLSKAEIPSRLNAIVKQLLRAG